MVGRNVHGQEEATRKTCVGFTPFGVCSQQAASNKRLVLVLHPLAYVASKQPRTKDLCWLYTLWRMWPASSLEQKTCVGFTPFGVCSQQAASTKRRTIRYNKKTTYAQEYTSRTGWLLGRDRRKRRGHRTPNSADRTDESPPFTPTSDAKSCWKKIMMIQSRSTTTFSGVRWMAECMVSTQLVSRAGQHHLQCAEDDGMHG
jgi:hypothetical protein